jgi:predicted transcriptional regulator
MSERRRYVCGHRLPAAEADVLELLLEQERPLSVAEIQVALPGRRRAHTTISTLLGRLAERGLVTRSARSREFEWSPAGSEHELALGAIEQVLANVNEPDAVVLSFLAGRQRKARRASARRKGAAER